MGMAIFIAIHRLCPQYSLNQIVNVASINLRHVNIQPDLTIDDGETGDIDPCHEQEIDAEPDVSQPVNATLPDAII